MHTDCKLSTEPNEFATFKHQWHRLLCSLRRKIIQRFEFKNERDKKRSDASRWMAAAELFTIWFLPFLTSHFNFVISPRAPPRLHLPFSRSRTSDAQIIIISIAVIVRYQSTLPCAPYQESQTQARFTAHLFGPSSHFSSDNNMFGFGRLGHIVFDLIAISTILAGVKKSTGYS